MIDASITENYRYISKVTILDSRQVFYPLRYVLQKRDISYNEDHCVEIKPLPEEVKFPASAKITDAGQINDYRVELSVNNQSEHTEEQLVSLHNRKVIIILHYPGGRMIIGCNEMPLSYIYSDDNTSNPASDNGYSIKCRGNSYFLKVSI